MNINQIKTKLLLSISKLETMGDTSDFAFVLDEMIDQGKSDILIHYITTRVREMDNDEPKSA